MALTKIKASGLHPNVISQSIVAGTGISVMSNNGQLTITGQESGVKITTVAYPSSATAADIAGSQTITVTGSGFNANITAYVNATLCTTTYGNSTSLTFVTPATSAGTYNIIVYNTDGTSGTKPGGILFSPPPIWVTAIGALTSATLNQAYSTSVSATGTGITYGVTSGALPNGLSLNSSSGAITGTPTVANTFNFTITATNANNQTTARAFSIVVASVVTADFLAIAGGGAGGTGYYGGGGGAGGYIESTTNFVLNTTYTITIGAGGAASGSTTLKGNPGANTTITGSGFTTITAIGGGGGGSRNGDTNGPGAQGGNGGSGGGASFIQNVGGKGVYPGSTYISATRQGYDGGSAESDNTYSAGGGGAGGPGQSASGSPPRAAGPGLASSITGTSVTRGGGGGNAYGTSYPGSGGGGAQNTAGTANTGGGGGGGSGNAAAGGAGGTGVVIIKYPDTYSAATTTGSPTVTSITGYRIYTFTGTGTISFN